MENALELFHVAKSYPNFEMKDLNLKLPSGCIMGLVGANGAGKSTVVKLIMNTISRSRGDIFVLGQDNTASAFRETREDIGIVLDEAYFPDVITARKLNEMMHYAYTRWDSEHYFALLRRFELPETQAFKTFSRGMKMKLAMAVALSHGARLLVLDEPTGGLDPVVRDEILDLLNDFTRNPEHSILISSHIVSDLEKICDYIAFLNHGTLQLCEEKDWLMEKYAVAHVSIDKRKDLPSGAIVGSRETEFGIDALVERALMPSSVTLSRASLEDIIIYMSKGDYKI